MSIRTYELMSIRTYELMSIRTYELTNMKIYGIKNCDTVKKALVYFEKNKIPYEFHDYKSLGIDSKKIKEWNKEIPLDKLVNAKGTTYRSLSEEEKLKLQKISTATPIIVANTSLIKRPLIEHMGKIILGFNEEEYDNVFKKIKK
jgi:arsenate reductase (glutaredoxin)